MLQGYNIHIGRNVEIGASTVILDCAEVRIGDYTEIGPNVQIYTVGHPIDPALRNGRDGPQYAKPVSISSYVTVGGGAIITGVNNLLDSLSRHPVPLSPSLCLSRSFSPFFPHSGAPDRPCRKDGQQGYRYSRPQDCVKIAIAGGRVITSSTITMKGLLT